MDRHALVISYHAPQPDRDSGSRRVFHFLQLLQESGWEVVVYAADGAGAAHDVRRLTQQGIPVYDGYAHSIDDVLGDRRFELVLIAYWPNAERYLKSPAEMARLFRELPEAPEGGTLFRVLFLAALLLFCLTFAVNTVAEVVRLRLRRRYRYL